MASEAILGQKESCSTHMVHRVYQQPSLNSGDSQWLVDLLQTVGHLQYIARRCIKFLQGPKWELE